MLKVAQKGKKLHNKFVNCELKQSLNWKKILKYNGLFSFRTNNWIGLWDNRSLSINILHQNYNK